MKKLLLILIFILCAAPVWAAGPWHIDCGDADGGVEGTNVDPWATFAEFEAEAVAKGFVAGDTVNVTGTCDDTVVSTFPAAYVACAKVDTTYTATVGSCEINGAAGSVIAFTLTPAASATGTRSFTGFVFDDDNVGDGGVSTTAYLDPTNATASPTTFTNCTFQATAGGTNGCQYVVNTSTDWGNAITFSGCTFTNDADGFTAANARYVNLTGSGGAATFSSCTWTVANSTPQACIYLTSAAAATATQSLTVQGSTFNLSIALSSNGGIIAVKQGVIPAILIDGNTFASTAAATAGTFTTALSFAKTISSLIFSDNVVTYASASSMTPVGITGHTNAMPDVQVLRNTISTAGTGAIYCIVLQNSTGAGNNLVDGAIIEDNKLTCTGGAANGVHGIATIGQQQCHIRNNTLTGFWLGIIAKSGQEAGEDYDWGGVGGIYGNLITNVQGAAVSRFISAKGACGVPIYNNTCVNTAAQNDVASGIRIELGDDSEAATGNFVKNNIVVTPSTTAAAANVQMVVVGVGCSATFSNNIYYCWGNAPYFSHLGVDDHSFADWDVHVTDTDSSVDNPDLFDTTNGFLWPISGSPAIGTGANLGSSWDDGLAEASSWPSDVRTTDRDDHVTWDIGAYVAQPFTFN